MILTSSLGTKASYTDIQHYTILLENIFYEKQSISTGFYVIRSFTKAMCLPLHQNKVRPERESLSRNVEADADRHYNHLENSEHGARSKSSL